jgi:hypothetical protein
MNTPMSGQPDYVSRRALLLLGIGGLLFATCGSAGCPPPTPPPTPTNVCGDNHCDQNETENCATCPSDCPCPGITKCKKVGPPDFPPTCEVN